jgi:hypothetical protein
MFEVLTALTVKCFVTGREAVQLGRYVQNLAL